LKLEHDSSLEERLRQLIEATDRDFQDQDHNWRRDLKPYKPAIIDALDSLKVFDPACGSGAFPIGMMQLLLKVYGRLEARFDSQKTKLQIIERNIFGVDIDYMAVEISRLRAWLALIVDEQVDGKSVKPLPNLDFKFVTANALIGLEEKGQLAFFEDAQLDLKLQQLRSAYFSTNSKGQKEKLKASYLSLVKEEQSLFGESRRTTQLKTFNPFESGSIAEFFDPVEMFGVSTFDIVIGNPPYVRQEKIRYKNSLRYFSIFDSTADLCTYFFEMAQRFLSPGGSLSFIVTDKFTKSLYGKNLRKLLSQSFSIDFVFLHGAEQQFAASVNTLVIQARLEPPSQDNKLSVFRSGGAVEGENLLQLSLGESAWTFLPVDSSEVFAKLTSSCVGLKNYLSNINLGIKTGSTEAFTIDLDTKDRIVTEDPNSDNLIFPVFAGRDLSRFAPKAISKYLIVTKNGLDIEKDFPSLASHLKEVDERLSGKVKARGDKGRHWMNLRDCAYYDKIEGQKIAWSDIAKVNQFCLVPKGVYITNTVQ
jgi:hypothetical protein